MDDERWYRSRQRRAIQKKNSIGTKVGDSIVSSLLETWLRVSACLLFSRVSAVAYDGKSPS